jgi:hypothetical protein
VPCRNAVRRAPLTCVPLLPTRAAETRAQWSFLYAEYKPNTCFWEIVIMFRKLAFLAATILLPMVRPHMCMCMCMCMWACSCGSLFMVVHAHGCRRLVGTHQQRI